MNAASDHWTLTTIRRHVFSVLLTLIAGMVVTTCITHAATWHIRAQAEPGGDGTDWNSALTTLPDDLVRGDTYYIAGGDYGSYRFDDLVTGNDLITLRKATLVDHGADTGWRDEYGALPADFHGMFEFYTGWYVIDGATGGGTGGYGIRIIKGDGDHTPHVKTYLSHVVDNVFILHVEMGHGGQTSSDGMDCMYLMKVSDWTIADCYLHDSTRTFIISLLSKRITIERSTFINLIGEQDVGYHSGGVVFNASGDSHSVVRYCYFDNVNGTCCVEPKTGADGLPTRDIHVYGNVFANSYHTNGTVGNVSGSVNENMHVYNNTFYNIRGPGTGVSWLNSDTNTTRNNLWVNCDNVLNQGGDSDYNLFVDCVLHWAMSLSGHDRESDGPMLRDPSNGDFGLIAATTGGIRLDAPFDSDPNGVNRGGDGVWDRGAFEFTQPVPPPAIESVVLEPFRGLLGIGDSVSITVRAVGEVSGLTVTPVTFNSRPIVFEDKEDGSYRGVYVLTEGDPDVIAPGLHFVKLAGEGGTSEPVSVQSDLILDCTPPAVQSIGATPSSGVLTSGDSLVVTVRAKNDETGLETSVIQVNGKPVVLADRGDGLYRGVHVVSGDDEPSGVVMVDHVIMRDEAGNLSTRADKSFNMLSIAPEMVGVEEDVLQELSLTCYPNPFNPSTTLKFNVVGGVAPGGRSHVELVIYALDGSMVRRLVSSPFPAGSHTVVWNGQDGHGRSVAAGMYLARIMVGGRQQTVKMMLVK